MKIEVKSYNSVALLINSIIMFILGAVMFTNPNEVVKYASYILGGLIFIMGIYFCVRNYLDVKKNPETNSSGMIVGVVLLIIGLVVIFLSGAIEFLVRFIIGGWILFSGINRLVIALKVPQKDNKFIILLVLAIFLIVGGIYTVLSTNLLFKYLGLVLMIYATLEIIGFIFSRKEEIEINVNNTNISDDNKITYDVKEAEVKEEKVEEKEDSKKTKNKKRKNKKGS